MEKTVSSKNAKTVRVNPGKNPRHLYLHQSDAIAALNIINEREEFRALVILPTGAGKTMTAATWLLSSAIDKKKKVLWLAHRHLLLEQAADAFVVNSFSDRFMNRQSFRYRIISGSDRHGRPVHIKIDDDILVVSKDSIARNLQSLDDWLQGEDELYLVIDEAHHATARSYRRIIDHLTTKVPHVKMLGLTATPFRTSEQEQGLLGKIFTDDIIYKIDLDTLIKRGILSTPICESCDTEIMVGDELGLQGIKSIEHLDVIPEDVAEYIADNKERNRFIVETYFANYQKYGQTLVFALSRLHAFTLKKLFNDSGKKFGIQSGVIVTGTKADFIGIDISNEENNRQLELYRNGEIQILINVNILTEGVDLPKTQTVFLTRPTISTVLMTQMIGRALRGEQAGGTNEAYIVSFVDNWSNKIAWVNPESILSAEESAFVDKEHQRKKQTIRLISIAKLEEFARIVNETVDTSRLEGIEFIQRIPLGMYVFTFIDENNMERNHQVLVYNNSEQRYLDLIGALPAIFEDFSVTEEYIDSTILQNMIARCEKAYFHHDMIPPYNRRDIEYLLKYFAQKESTPLFIPFEEVDRQKVNLAVIAKEIADKDMRRSEQNKYINALWEDEASLLRVYFGNKYFFNRQLEIEIDKQYGDYPVIEIEDHCVGEEIEVISLSLHEIRKIDPEYWQELRDSVYASAKFPNGNYCCALCAKQSWQKGLFEIDHILPISKGGKSTLDNLQLLCRTCNRQKSDRIVPPMELAPVADRIAPCIDERMNLSSVSLDEISRKEHEYCTKLYHYIYAGAQLPNGDYHCATCTKQSPHKAWFKIDHILAMSKGGKTTLDNLQLVCRNCQRKKREQT